MMRLRSGTIVEYPATITKAVCSHNEDILECVFCADCNKDTTTKSLTQDCSGSSHWISSSPLFSCGSSGIPSVSARQSLLGSFLVPQGLCIKYDPRSQVVQIAQADLAGFVSPTYESRPSPTETEGSRAVSPSALQCGGNVVAPRPSPVVAPPLTNICGSYRSPKVSWLLG